MDTLFKVIRLEADDSFNCMLNGTIRLHIFLVSIFKPALILASDMPYFIKSEDGDKVRMFNDDTTTESYTALVLCTVCVCNMHM